MNSIRYLNGILTVLTIVVAMQLCTTWTTGPQLGQTAQAQGIPDAGSQRRQIVDQLKLLNKKTEEVKALLTSGKVRVTVQLPEEGKDGNGQK